MTDSLSITPEGALISQVAGLIANGLVSQPDSEADFSYNDIEHMVKVARIIVRKAHQDPKEFAT